MDASPTINALFAQALREKLRFSTPQGTLSVEDLWDLPLTVNRSDRVSLDSLAQDLHQKLKEAEGNMVSFVKPTAKTDDRTQMSFDLVMFVLQTKLAERDAAEKARVNAETKQKLLGILARRQDAELEGKSADEIQAMIASLG